MVVGSVALLWGRAAGPPQRKGRGRMLSVDYGVVEAAARKIGWERSGPGWRGPCPVTGVATSTVERGERANDKVLMRCSNTECISPRPGVKPGALGPDRYYEHKMALLAAGS